MSENFRKIKKKYLTVAIIASCILGACLGVALACTLAVVFKTCGVNVHWAVYIPVALVLAAGAGWLFFLILRPNDKRIAKKLDRDFALNQKVQTMVEFAQVEGEIPALQREQTNEALGAVAKKRVDLKWLLKFAFVPVIAAAMLFAGIFVPAKKSAVVDPPYDITPAHETALKNLIEDVKGSSLEIGLKSFTLVELDALLDGVREAGTVSVMKDAVISAVHNIDSLVGNANSYVKIDSVLRADELLATFSTAVVNSVVNYKNGASLTSMRQVREREADAEERIESVLTTWKATYLADYAPREAGAESGTPLPVEEAAVKLKAFADALSAGLADSELVKKFAPQSGEEEVTARAAAEGDAHYNNLTALAAELTRHAISGGDGNDTMFYNNTDGYLTGFITGGKVALATQSYNCMMDDYLRNALSRIFNISRAEFGSNADVAPAPTEEESGGNKKEENNGGYGDGVHKFGSNDEILDPDSGEKKKYGDLVDPDNPDGDTYYSKYYNRAMEYLNNPDKCPPKEVADYIRQYFAYLNNGIEEDKNN